MDLRIFYPFYLIITNLFGCVLAISGLNNGSSYSSAVADLQHQIVDNERFMMKYAASNTGSSDSQHRSKLLNDESTTSSVFAEQIRSSKKLNPSSSVQSGTFFTIVIIFIIFYCYFFLSYYCSFTLYL
jgi:hypothetical protein